jgi:ABC-2 type transport system ATP-binding protein
MIEFNGLSKQYGRFNAVNPLNLRVAAGELFGFVGPSGAGKSTTIRMMMGLLVPTSGSVRIDGYDCQVDGVEIKRRIGYVPDNPVFYDYLRGHEILEFVAQMHGFSRAQARARTQRLLAEFGLDDAGEEFAVNYSMGMKKKLALACALIHQPRVLVLDEPIDGLDPGDAREVNERLLQYVTHGVTIFFSTDRLDMAERLCSRAGIIHHGKLLATGTLDEIRATAATNGSLEDAFPGLTNARTAAHSILAHAF